MRIAHFVIVFFLTQGIFSQNAMLFNADEIRERGIFDIRDLTTVVPGLFVSSLGSAHSTAVYMRGVGSCGNSPAVGLYVDDVEEISVQLNTDDGAAEYDIAYQYEGVHYEYAVDAYTGDVYEYE